MKYFLLVGLAYIGLSALIFSSMLAITVAVFWIFNISLLEITL